MINVEIPKDIRQYEAKLIGPFTPRQTAFFVPGCICAIVVYKLVSNIAPMDVAAFSCMVTVVPFVLFGWVKIYGMPLEDFIKSAFVSNVLSPTKRKYKTENTFEVCFEEFEEKQKPIKKEKKIKKAKNPELQSYF